MDTWRNGCFEKMADHPVHTTLNHHPSKIDVLPKTFLQIILAVKWLVRHSSTSPNQQRRPVPSLLYLSLFYGWLPVPTVRHWFKKRSIISHTLAYIFFYSVGSGRPTGPPAWLWQTQAAWRAGWPRAQPTNQRHSPHPWRSQGRSWRPGTSAACRSANTDHNIKWFLLNAIFNILFGCCPHYKKRF